MLEGANPMERYGLEPCVLRAVASLVRQANAGDIVIFGAYDGYDIVSFDDQVGAHGSAGGDQVWPFLVTPPQVDVSGERIEDAKDIHRVVMLQWAKQERGPRNEEVVLDSRVDTSLESRFLIPRSSLHSTRRHRHLR